MVSAIHGPQPLGVALTAKNVPVDYAAVTATDIDENDLFPIHSKLKRFSVSDSICRGRGLWRTLPWAVDTCWSLLRLTPRRLYSVVAARPSFRAPRYNIDEFQPMRNAYKVLFTLVFGKSSLHDSPLCGPLTADKLTAIGFPESGRRFVRLTCATGL